MNLTRTEIAANIAIGVGMGLIAASAAVGVAILVRMMKGADVSTAIALVPAVLYLAGVVLGRMPQWLGYREVWLRSEVARGQ